MHSGGCSGADLLSSDSPDRGKEPDMPSEPAPQVKLAIAHVLFIDIVGYSKLLITQQTELLGKLTALVRETEQFQAADKKGGLVRIPTGDGLALVFRDSPDAPAQCAMELDRRLKAHSELQVRMGIHSGPINEVVDGQWAEEFDRRRD